MRATDTSQTKAAVRRWFHNNGRLVLAAIATGTVYNLDGWLIPELEQGAIDQFHLSAGVAGFFPTTENLMVGLVSILLSRRSPLTDFRKPTVVALALWFAGNGLMLLTPSIPLLIVCRLLAGIGAGVLIYVSSTLAAVTLRPDRTYSLLTVCANAYAAAVIATPPPASLTGSGHLSVYPYAAALTLIWIPLALLAPRELRDSAAAAPVGAGGHTQPSVDSSRVAALVLALNAFGLYAMGNFAFAIALATRVGMNDSDTQWAMGAAVLVGTLGALAVSFLPRRAGHVGPLLIALLLSLVANLLITTTQSPQVLRFGMMGSQVTSFFIIPLLLGWSALLDPSGRTATLMNGSLMMTGALAPIAGGYLIGHGSLSSLAAETAAAGGIAMACVVLVAWRSRQREPKVALLSGETGC